MAAKALRILHIIDSLDPRNGGTVECVRQIGSSVVRSGHQVEVAICRDSPGDAWLDEFPLKVHPLGPGVGKYSYSRALRPWLARHGKEYDAWVINGLWQYQGLGASRLAQKLGIPYFVYAHGMLDPWNRRAHPFKYVKKFLYWLIAERSTMEQAQHLVFTSEAEAVLARDYFPTARWDPLVVGNGIAPPPPVPQEAVDEFRARYQVAAGQRVLLFLGRIHPKKGIELLVNAFSKLPPDSGHVVVIAGDGESGYVAALKQLAEAKGIAHAIRWTGPLYGAHKWAAFTAAELFVLPSHQENFGIAVVEALAAGTPVCTTTAVNIHATVTQYNAGLICHDDEVALASALKRWQTLTAAEISDYRTRALRCYRNEFQVSTPSSRLLTAITKAVFKNVQPEGATV
jgi:glycosyltransferase involved in cell wall biosynthesis